MDIEPARKPRRKPRRKPPKRYNPHHPNPMDILNPDPNPNPWVG
jgi:hypothetical protein